MLFDNWCVLWLSVHRVLQEDRVLPGATSRPLQAPSYCFHTVEERLRHMEHSEKLQPAAHGKCPSAHCQGDSRIYNEIN